SAQVSSGSSHASSAAGFGGFGTSVATSSSGGGTCGPKPFGTPVQECFAWGKDVGCPSIEDAWAYMPYCCPEGLSIVQIVDGPIEQGAACCYHVIWQGNCSSGLEK